MHQEIDINPDFEPIIDGALKFAAHYGLWAFFIFCVVIGSFWRGPALIKAISDGITSIGTMRTEHIKMKRIQDREDKKLEDRINRSREKAKSGKSASKGRRS